MSKLHLLNDQALGEIKSTRKDGLGFSTYARVLSDLVLGMDALLQSEFSVSGVLVKLVY